MNCLSKLLLNLAICNHLFYVTKSSFVTSNSSLGNGSGSTVDDKSTKGIVFYATRNAYVYTLNDLL